MSDVYVAARSLGGVLKASLHESGVCHVRAPDPRKWRSPGPPPNFLDTWTIDPQAAFAFPFGVIIPTSELRAGPWPKQKETTKWLLPKALAVEIGVFLTRIDPPQGDKLTAAGWHTTIVADALPDGRHLWVLAGDPTLAPEKQAELDVVKTYARRAAPAAPGNYRLMLLATNDAGTRRFVEAALDM
jgi:hypothetical protein